MNARWVEPLDLPRPAAQLTGLERQVSRGGRDHPSGGRHDLADAAADGVVAAVEGPASQPREPEDNEPLNRWGPELLEHEAREECGSNRHRPRRE